MPELPPAVVEKAVRLTRLARGAADEAEAAAYRSERDAALAEHGYVARTRTDDGDPVLVCHPAEWVADGRVRPDRIEDVDRAVERPLAGTGEAEDWAAVEAHNREIVRAVEAAHGPVHGATVAAFADFMGNHYVRRLEAAGPRELAEFLEEYLPRNAWPSDEQRAVAATSVRLAFEAAGVEPPAMLDGGGDWAGAGDEDGDGAEEGEGDGDGAEEGDEDAG